MLLAIMLIQTCTNGLIDKHDTEYYEGLDRSHYFGDQDNECLDDKGPQKHPYTNLRTLWN